MSLIKAPSCQHKKGWTTAIYDPLGERILSAGADGKIKILNGLEDASPMEHVIGEKINAIAFRQETIVVATEGTHVYVIQAEDGLQEGLATRFTAEVMHITLNKDGEKLAACSSDFNVKMVDFTSEDREFTLEGHTGGVLSVSFDPMDIFLASASCDGTVRIWRLDERKCVKSLPCLSPCNDPVFALSLCRLSWESTSGQFLAVPVDKQISMYERITWDLLCSLSCPCVEQPIIVCTSSFDGTLLAGGSEDGWVVVWRVADRHALYRIRDPAHSAINSLVWNPQLTALLLYANQNGYLGQIRLPEAPFPENGALSPNTLNALMGCDEDGDADELLRVAAAQAESSRLVDEDEAQKLLEMPDDDDDADDADSIDLSRIKSTYMALDDEGDEDGGGGRDVKVTAPTLKSDMGLNTADAAQGSSRIPVSMRAQKAFQPGSMPLGFRERFMVWNRVGVVIQYRSSSEMNEADNSALMDTDGRNGVEGAASIEVEFHDTTVHHSLQLSNRSAYTMADLSMTAVLLASAGTNDPSLADDADAGEPVDPSDVSQIALLPLDTTTGGGGGGVSTAAGSSEWTVQLPPGEACEAICLVPDEENPATRGLAVVATTRNLLRIFTQPSPSTALSRSNTSNSGLRLFQLTQLGLPPVSIPGKGVLAMCSHAVKPILGVVINSSTAGGHDPMWRVYYLGGQMLGDNRTRTPVWLTGGTAATALSWQPLPLSPCPVTQPTRLTWFGFSDMGSLYTHDSTGIIRRLIHTRSASQPDLHWAPVCDSHAMVKSSNRRSDTYFLVGVVESMASGDSVGQLQTIYCKASKWPRVFPRPVVSGLSFRLPLCGLGTDQADLEENYLRYLINTDWPVWGSDEGVSTEETELQRSLSVNCLNKRKAILLRLFALSAKLESDWASLAVAQLMPDASTVQLAIRYAGRLRRPHLADRLAGVALAKEQAAQIVSSEDEEESDAEMVDRGSRMAVMRRTVHESGASHSSRVHRDVPDPWVNDSRNRHPSGYGPDETANLSLVSSATDDTSHHEGNISGLPLLADSEPFSQSVLAPDTPSSASRNPFKGSSKPAKSLDASGRGSEVLDSWKPSPATPSTSKVPVKSQSKPTGNASSGRGSKKRGGPVPSSSEPAKKRPSKMSRPTAREESSAPSGTSLVGFMDWFDAHREELEEEYPDHSAEQLLVVARVDFQKATLVEKTNAPENAVKDNGQPVDSINVDEADESEPEKENQSRAKDVLDGAVEGKQQPPQQQEQKASFAEKASKRLSSFRFASQANE